MDKSFYPYLLIAFTMFLFISCQTNTPFGKTEQGFRQFLTAYEKTVEPLTTAHNQAQWDAYTTGSQSFFDKSMALSLKIDSVYQNKDDFAYLKDLREKNVIENQILKRQLDILYLNYLNKQIDRKLNKEITELASKIEGIYANFRAVVQGEKYSDNQITKILQTELDLEQRESIWKGQKALGDRVAPILVNLAKLRNQAARELGYSDYYELALTSTELDPKQVEAVFTQLQELTEEPFIRLHDKIEQVFVNRYNIDKSKIRPWHYEDLFAQSAPSIFEINLDRYYEKTDIPELAKNFYASAQIEVEDILKQSDLFEREGKSQHAFSFFIDRKNDIRILCNIVPNERWMETMLHELGHAVYDKYLDPSLPFLLREPAHPFTTEGIAMFFGSFSSNANWIQNALKISDKEKKRIEKVSRANLRLSKMIFARWSMVVLNFEKSFYTDPEQDLNTLWWDLVKKYQKINPPDTPVGNEWATKLHIATYPVYYQNYQLGELFASQILDYVARNYYGEAALEEVIFWEKPDAGKYFKNKIFSPGKRLPWNEMIREATGQPLSAEFFVNQYVRDN
jgi:peptidyl-dipeptidase A